MTWWGKIVGSGLGLFAGPMGAMIGGYIGHRFDENTAPALDEKKAKLLYYGYFFSCAAKVSKADGHISAKEIATVETLIKKMNLSSVHEQFAKDIFRKSGKSTRSISEDYSDCAKLIRYNQTIAHSFMRGLFDIATCELKQPNKTQLKFLLSGQDSFRMPKGTIRSWYKTPNTKLSPQEHEDDLSDCYQILGALKGVSYSELKNCYREKIRSIHPDKLENKNLPEDLIVFAKEQTIRINLAFEKIKKNRGFK